MWIECKKLWVDWKIKKEVREDCEPQRKHHPLLTSPKHQSKKSRPHCNHQQRVRPIVEKQTRLRRFDSSVCQHDPDEVRQESAYQQRPSRGLRNAALDRKTCGEMRSVHVRMPLARRTR